MSNVGKQSRDSQEALRQRTLVLCDTSGSMDNYTGQKRRIDVLRDVLVEITPPNYSGSVWQFDSFCREVFGPPYSPGEPSGGTDLAGAIATVARFQPRPLIVVSDGVPQDGEAALAEARALNTRIITRFVGDDADFGAIAFMRALAWCSDDGIGDAQVHRWDRPQALADDLRALLLEWEGDR